MHEDLISVYSTEKKIKKIKQNEGTEVSKEKRYLKKEGFADNQVVIGPVALYSSIHSKVSHVWNLSSHLWLLFLLEILNRCHRIGCLDRDKDGKTILYNSIWSQYNEDEEVERERNVSNFLLSKSVEILMVKIQKFRKLL